MKVNIQDQFEIIDNTELKRFEFNSKNNNHCSYTIDYKEADNIDDAIISVWKAIIKQ